MNQPAGTCSGCGAAVPVALAPTRYVCPYCGREQLIGAPLLVPPPPPLSPLQASPFDFRGGPADPPAAASARTAVLVVVLLVGFFIAVGVIALVVGGHIPGAGSAIHMQWDGSGSSSVVVVGDVNGDGIEDFVGRVRMFDPKPGTQLTEVALFDGKTLDRVWTAGPYGALAQANGATHVAVAGGRVVVTDFREQAHVLDLKTGKELAAVKLPDRADAACSPVDARSQVWIKVSGGQSGVLDTATSRWAPGPQPAWCSRAGQAVCGGLVGGGDACEPNINELRAVPGLLPRVVFHGTPVDVVIAMKLNGAPGLTAVGLDATTHAVRWRMPLAPDPAFQGPGDFSGGTLRDGKLVTAYFTSPPDVLHALELDAATGARLLDVPFSKTIPADQAGTITVSATRAYIPHWVWLEVVDLKTKALVGRAGVW